MSAPPFPEIKTRRLLLRRLQDSDWEMICYLRTDKNINKFVERPSAKSKEEALAFIQKINSAIENEASFYWAITIAGNDQMIGSICFWNFSTDRKIAEVGYDLSPEFQGKGIMNESLKNVLSFGFTNINLDLIEAYTHQHNEPSKNLLTRNRFILVLGKKDEDNDNNLVFELKKSGWIP